MSKNLYRERRIYSFACEGCGRGRAQSYKRSRAKKKLCRKCRLNQPNENQTTLFDSI